MTEQNPQPVKQNPIVPIKNFVVKHRCKFLAAATVASIATNVVLKNGISQHNEFLKEQGLYEQFYNVSTPGA